MFHGESGGGGGGGALVFKADRLWYHSDLDSRVIKMEEEDEAGQWGSLDGVKIESRGNLDQVG